MGVQRLLVVGAGTMGTGIAMVFANAGLSAPTPLGRTDVATFEKQVQLNFISVFFTVQGALPLLRDGADRIPATLADGERLAPVALPQRITLPGGAKFPEGHDHIRQAVQPGMLAAVA